MDGGEGEGFNRGTMYEWKLSEAASAALRQVSGAAPLVADVLQRGALHQRIQIIQKNMNKPDHP